MTENGQLMGKISKNDSGSVNHDAFKELFKYFKRKCPPPDLTSVVDFSNEDRLQQQDVTQFSLESKTKNYAYSEGQLFECGLKPLHLWKLYCMKAHPGLIFIRNPFTQRGLNFWMGQCFDQYWKHPNPTNLKLQTVDQSEVLQMIEQKLRWATLGYHHDWDSKEYSENFKGQIPEELDKLARCIADCAGFPDFRTEAAIVNYYALDSSLGGHTDHSEKNHTAPLLSFSFGQSAIFLIGGKDKTIKPSPIKICNGDVVIMSGDSRLCYHAVPKILSDTHWNSMEDGDSREENGEERWWWPLASKMRLNLNVRQVNV